MFWTDPTLFLADHKVTWNDENNNNNNNHNDDNDNDDHDVHDNDEDNDNENNDDNDNNDNDNHNDDNDNNNNDDDNIDDNNDSNGCNDDNNNNKWKSILRLTSFSVRNIGVLVVYCCVVWFFFFFVLFYSIVFADCFSTSFILVVFFLVAGLFSVCVSVSLYVLCCVCAWYMKGLDMYYSGGSGWMWGCDVKWCEMGVYE